MRRWQPGVFKTGDQPSADIAMRQHHIEYGVQALLQFDVEVDGRKCVRADMTCRLVERDDPSMTYGPRHAPYHGHGVRLVVQNVAADCSVECQAFGKGLVRGDHEFNLSMPGRQDAR